MARDENDNSRAAKPSRSRIFRTFKGVLIAVATAAVGCALVYAVDGLRREVRADPVYQMSAESLSLVQGPAWLTPGIREELRIERLAPDFPARFSLLDSGVSARIAAAYARCLWVERVERIVKHDPRVDRTSPPLEVFLKFRRPMAFVQWRDGFCLVDDKAVRLPGVYSEPRLGTVALLVISGAASPPPDAGGAWEDEAVQAGVRVAEAVDPKRQTFRLTTIDVSNVGGRRDPHDTEIALYTANDTRIKWGKAPTAEAALLQEKTPGEKVAYLEFVYQRLNGQVDGVLSYIDIPNEAIRRRSVEMSATRLRS